MELTTTEKRILQLFSERMNLADLDQVKLLFGWRQFITDSKKAFVIYSLSLLLNCFVETFLVHLSFYFFRQVAFGAHSKGFWSCLLVSSLTFPFSALLFKTIQLNSMHMWIAFCISAIPLLLFAPVGTAVNVIRGTAHAQYLRKKMYRRLILFILLLLFLPISFTKFLLAGLLIEAFSIMLAIIRRGG